MPSGAEPNHRFHRAAAGALLAVAAFMLSGLGSVGGGNLHPWVAPSAPGGGTISSGGLGGPPISAVGNPNVRAPAHAHSPPPGISAGPADTPSGPCRAIAFLDTEVACAGKPAPAVPSVGSPSIDGWSYAGPIPPAFAQYDFQMTYDAADGYVLLFGALAGAYYGTAGATETWAFHAGNWAQIQTTTSPQSCTGSNLVYDSEDGYVLYLAGGGFGYATVCPSSGQTWSYQAGVWTQLHPTTSPSPRFGAGLVDDVADGYLLLFGGVNQSCPAYEYCNDTWTFQGGSWSQLSPTASPDGRAQEGLAYDAYDGSVILFGGVYASPWQLNDTWSFSQGNWTKLAPAHTPPVPLPDALIYDSSDSELVYTTYASGNRTGPNFPEITWTYQAGDWTKVNASSPPGRVSGEMADDPPDGCVVFFGGADRWVVQYADTWTFHAGVWTNLTAATPPGRAYAAMAFDSAGGSVVMFGGVTVPAYYASSYLNDTWTFSSGAWSLVPTTTAPSPRTRGGLVYDASDDYLLLYGGTDLSEPLNDTWEFAGGSWTRLTPSVSPPANWDDSLVYDQSDGYVVLLTGTAGNMSTWTFHAGVWTDRTSTGGTEPPGPAFNALVYDSTDGYVMLFGPPVRLSTGYWQETSQTWKFFGGFWSNLTGAIGTAPPPSIDAAVADFASGGYTVFWDGSDPNDTWTYSNLTWTERFAPLGPTSRTGMVGTWDPGDSVAVFFGGSNSVCAGVGDCDETWYWTDRGPNVPQITSFQATPSTTDVSLATNLSVTTRGGVDPLSYAYLGLPSGCASQNRSLLPCTPTVAGTFEIQATVTDAQGNRSVANLTLTVNPLPSVTGFSAYPSTIGLGGTSILRVLVSGGTGPITYVYSGLPNGCSSQTVPALPCTPASSGNFAIQVDVADGLGASATAGTFLYVNPAGAPGAPSVSAFAASPTELILGNATNLSVVATGGVGFLSYTYAGLPTGCSTANVTTLACTPTAAGVFLVTVVVSDSAGSTTAVGTNVTVYPVGGGAGLLITGFGAVPGRLSVGQVTVFTVAASGGIGLLGFAYEGLPPGCLSSDTPYLSCSPDSVGEFRVRVIVSDTAANSAGVRTPLSVVPASGNGGTLLSIVSFYPTPLEPTVGQSLLFQVVVQGGTAPFLYYYAGLPGGCRSTSTPTLACAPAASGSFDVTVTATDSLGGTASATTPLTVAPAGSSPPPGETGGTGSSLVGLNLYVALTLGIVAGALAGAGAIYVVLVRRRRFG